MVSQALAGSAGPARQAAEIPHTPGRSRALAAAVARSPARPLRWRTPPLNPNTPPAPSPSQMDFSGVLRFPRQKVLMGEEGGSYRKLVGVRGNGNWKLETMKGKGGVRRGAMGYSAFRNNPPLRDSKTASIKPPGWTIPAPTWTPSSPGSPKTSPTQPPQSGVSKGGFLRNAVYSLRGC